MAPDSSSSQVVAEQVRKRPFRPGGWTFYGQVGLVPLPLEWMFKQNYKSHVYEGFFQNENLLDRKITKNIKNIYKILRYI